MHSTLIAQSEIRNAVDTMTTKTCATLDDETAQSIHYSFCRILCLVCQATFKSKLVLHGVSCASCSNQNYVKQGLGWKDVLFLLAVPCSLVRVTEHSSARNCGMPEILQKVASA